MLTQRKKELILGILSPRKLECERNVLASNDFRLRCDSRRSFRRAIRGEFLDAAMFLSTRCFSRTFSRFGSEAGQFSAGC